MVTDPAAPRVPVPPEVAAKKPLADELVRATVVALVAVVLLL